MAEKSKKKVFVIGPAYPLRGGLATFDERLCRAFTEAGHEAAVVSFSLQYPDFLFPGTTQYDTSGKAPEGTRIHTRINSINPFNWITTALFIRKEKPDFVIIRYWIPLMGPALGTIARLIRGAGIRVIALTDNVLPHEKRPGDKLFTRYFVGACQGFITMSEAVMQDLNTFTQTPHKRFLKHPIYDSFGEKVSKEEAREKLNLGAEDKIILFFGLIRGYKGLDLLLESMNNAEIRKLGVKLLIAGEFYEDRKYYDDIIQKHNLSEQIILHAGFVATEDVKYYFCASDLLTLTYKTATQSGVTQVAFHFEKPTLVTNVGGLGEIIPNGKCGYVVEKDEESIAKAIVDFYENKRENDFIEGMQSEKKKYDWQIFVQEAVDLYQSIQ